ncbi:MAG: hypothetical protein EZS28_005251 [Streblomastix strix]|uniref:Uncharacterized protein n=1 Tax=Streblomastix strix TaxID=222440 RepID=A0A5J4WW34_9EUKA|nr:MAG: hypothetical protein EZS28_005251 [Streblomastix strix]
MSIKDKEEIKIVSSDWIWFYEEEADYDDDDDDEDDEEEDISQEEVEISKTAVNNDNKQVINENDLKTIRQVLNALSAAYSAFSRFTKNLETWQKEDNFRLVRNALKVIEQITGSVYSGKDLAFGVPHFISSILSIASDKGICKENGIESSLIKSYCFDIINNLKKEKSRQVMEKMLLKYKEMKIMSDLMSSAGGCSNDYDDVISSCINNLFVNYSQASYMDRDEKLKQKQLISYVNNSIEEFGLSEEIDNLFFHTDTRRDVGIIHRVNEIKKVYIKDLNGQMTGGFFDLF